MIKLLLERSGFCAYVFLAAVTLWPSRLQAIVLHPDGEPNLVTWTDRPNNGVIGRWGDNASCVAIGRNYIISTAHQPAHPDGDANTPIVIDGTTYSIDTIWEHPTADLRVVKLRHANLGNYVDLYTSGDGSESQKEIVIGGYGDGRGQNLPETGTTYGYSWDNSANTTLRFCTNTISQQYLWPSDSIMADFDDLNVPGSTVYEGAVADHDSGGGWFIEVDGSYKVAGLSYGVEVFGESWFHNPDTGEPDRFYAWRVSLFADWISDIIDSQQSCDFIAADLNDDCIVDIADLAGFADRWLRDECGPDNNFCEGADFEPIDGDVDLADFANFAGYW